MKFGHTSLDGIEEAILIMLMDRYLRGLLDPFVTLLDVVTGQADVRGIEVPEVTEKELQALDDASEQAEKLIGDEAAAEVAQ